VLWGRAGVSYNRITSPAHLPELTVTNSATALNLSVPIMYHFVPHFFAAISPYYNLNFSGIDSYGFASVVALAGSSRSAPRRRRPALTAREARRQSRRARRDVRVAHGDTERLA
jgi:hypothetical protein